MSIRPVGLVFIYISEENEPREIIELTNDTYEISDILCRKIIKGKTHYQVKWKDYDEVTWVSHNDVSNERNMPRKTRGLL